MFDLPKAEYLQALSLTQKLLSIAISLVLVITPFSSSFATELQHSPAIELTKKGYLRVLYQKLDDQTLSVTQKEQELIENFALENHLTTEWIAIKEGSQLMFALIEGRGDVVIGQGELLSLNLSDQIKSTYAWGTIIQQVMVRTDTSKISRIEDLLVRQIALKRSSPSWSILEAYLPKNLAMDLLEISENTSLEEIIMRVASGEYDMTIVANDTIQTYLPKHPKVSIAFDLAESESRAWTVRSNAETLQSLLDKYLNKHHLSMIVANVREEYLPKTQKKENLRESNYQSASNDLPSNGKIHGFEYSFIKKFAQSTCQYDLKTLLNLRQPNVQLCVAKIGNPQLLTAIDISRPKNKPSQTKWATQVDKISPYDALVKIHAEQHSFDWRLIAAQMYQESQFDPYAISYAGAEGLMQIMPVTADELGIKELNDPKSNIAAGVKYMKILRDQFERELPLEDKTWFTLASYNAGFTRVKNARALADKMGLNSDRWFGNVEQAMLALSQPYTEAGKSKHLCRCGQTVVYVRKIKSLYLDYVRLTEITQIAKADIILRVGDI